MSYIRLTIVTFLLILCSCSLTATSQAATHGRAVIEGDSLTVDSVGYTRNALPGWEISQSSRVGRLISEGMSSLLSRNLSGISVVVVALGTNGYTGFPAWTPKWFRTQLERAWHYANSNKAKRCLVVPTIYDAGKPARSWNSVIYQFAGAHSRTVQVTKWAESVQQRKVRLGDGTHPSTAAGWSYRGRLIADAIESCSRKL